jgi:hypothetical protein
MSEIVLKVATKIAWRNYKGGKLCKNILTHGYEGQNVTVLG